MCKPDERLDDILEFFAGGRCMCKEKACLPGMSKLSWLLLITNGSIIPGKSIPLGIYWAYGMWRRVFSIIGAAATNKRLPGMEHLLLFKHVLNFNIFHHF